jgi:hypothetical protein
MPYWTTKEHLEFTIHFCFGQFLPGRFKWRDDNERKFAAHKIAEHLRISAYEISMKDTTAKTAHAPPPPGLDWVCCANTVVGWGKQCPVCKRYESEVTSAAE